MSPIKTILLATVAMTALASGARADGSAAMPSQERYQVADAGAVEPREAVRTRRVHKPRTVRAHKVRPGRLVNARAAWPEDRWAPIKVDTRVLANPPLGQKPGDTDSNAVGFILGLGKDSPAAGQYQLIPAGRGHATTTRR